MRLSERENPRFIIIQHPRRAASLSRHRTPLSRSCPFTLSPFRFPKMIVITFPASTKEHADKHTHTKKGDGGDYIDM